LEEDEAMEQHYMEAQIVQMDAREDNIINVTKLFTKVQVEV
jgi:hypothetical protein